MRIGERVLAAQWFEAVIVAETDPGRVSLRRSDDAGVHEARNAVLGYRPSAGDRVLCTEGARGVYVTGVLVASVATELRVAGASAQVEAGRIVIRDEGGTVLVSHDPAAGVTRVSASQTTLAIEATERLELKAKEVSVEAERLTHRVADLVTDAERISTSADRWELRVNRLTERAKNAFRDVECLLQTRAGTLRSIAREGMSLFARRTSIRSEKDTAIDGERVLLG